MKFSGRYFNDTNDYGHVEISVNGGDWQPLRRLYADPRLVPLNGRLQYHQFDLTEYIGQPLRVRFRYDNGVISFAPDSPGWWVDDMTISGGSWQTIAVTAADATTFTVNGRLAGQYFYRVRGLYADGTVSGWSQVVDMVSEAATLPPTPEGEGHQTTGGGWLATNSGEKINFGFHVEETDNGLSGNLQLNDKSAGVKIHLNTVTLIAAISGSCGGIPNAANTLMFEGTGRFNGLDGAGFRVCVQDNAEPGQGNDRFYLTCLAGCDYETADSAADDVIDGGNIQVRQRTTTPDEAPSSGQSSTVILNPLLLDKGIIGQPQLFSVTVYDENQELLPGAPVILQRVTAGGAVSQYIGQTDLFGIAVFTIINLNSTVEFMAYSAGAGSNAVKLSQILP